MREFDVKNLIRPKIQDHVLIKSRTNNLVKATG